jgi:hypothetical protein
LSINELDGLLEVSNVVKELLVVEERMRHILDDLCAAVALEILRELCAVFLRNEAILVAMDDQARTHHFLCPLFVVESLLQHLRRHPPIEVANNLAQRQEGAQ